MSESPATADQSTETRPKVDPTWRISSAGSWRLHLDGAEIGDDRQCVARVYGDNRWAVWPYINENGATYGGQGGDATGTDEAKAACVKALREVGCAFVGDPEPAAKPEPKGRIVRRWVASGPCWTLYFAGESGQVAAGIDGHEVVAWDISGPRLERINRAYRRGSMPLDVAKALAERWLTEAGYELVDPPAKPEPCDNGTCDCGDVDPDDRITLPETVDIEVLPDGARQSRLAERCDLLPPRAVLAVAHVMHEGAAKYGERNWETIPASSHINHALRHVLLYLSGDRQEKHLEHAACRALMALDKCLRDADG